jgi:hypothetical protein
MARIIRVKNNTGAEATWNGQTISAGEYHDIEEINTKNWVNDTLVFADVGNGSLVVNRGADDVDDILDPIIAWDWISGNAPELPLSDLGNKIGVHQTSKPDPVGKEFFLVWTGAGDDIANHEIGAGESLVYDFSGEGSPIPTSMSHDIQFDPIFGDVYLHEGYVRSGGSTSCLVSMSALVICGATSLQQVANLDLIVEDNWVKYSPTGPGTGTHGFAANPILLKRSFSHDGDWNYDPTSSTPLTPNMAGDGYYKISDIDRIAHKYINRVPIGGENGYTRLTSDETAWLPPGYYIRVIVDNPEAEPLKAACFFEVYRERTAVP